eukprot:TRINITY_DN40470_c0_g1_i1.p1 TRINITY_DN40470_c0_g1~~TRINITY_DN40470_c0_g1_i1.p1  ORF type:complete len:449 (+),score=99.37 TRINITY_DN40470_c0_g1_i1:171-1349(+)
MAPSAEVDDLGSNVDKMLKVAEGSKEEAVAKRTLFGSYASLWNRFDAAGDAEGMAALQELRPRLRLRMAKPGTFAKLCMVARLLTTVLILSWGSLCACSVGFLRLSHPLLRACGVPNGLLPMDIFTGLLFRAVLAAMGVKVRVEAGSVAEWGANPCGIIAYNHGSNLDPFIINLVCRHVAPKYVGKKSVFKIPIFGWLSLICGMVPINRGDREKAMHTMNEVVANIMQRWGRCVAVAPEGTRSVDGHLILPFKKGVFHLQERTKVPFLPLVIHGAYELWPPSQFFTSPGEIRVSVLAPQAPPSGGSKEVARVQLQRALADQQQKHVQWQAEPLSLSALLEQIFTLFCAAVVSVAFYRVFAALVDTLGLGTAGVVGIMGSLSGVVALYVDWFL